MRGRWRSWRAPRSVSNVFVFFHYLLWKAKLDFDCLELKARLAVYQRSIRSGFHCLLWRYENPSLHYTLCPHLRVLLLPCTLSLSFLRANVTTGYNLVKTRHSRVPTYLQRETDTADWSTPTSTLPCSKNGGVYPATSTFLQNCTPVFRHVPCWREVGPFHY